MTLRDVAEHAIAVVLDLVHPFVAAGRVVDERGELGLQPFGRSRLARSGDLGEIARGRLPPAHRARAHVLGDRLVRMPHAIGVGGDLLDAAARHDAVREIVDHGGVVARSRVLVVLLDEQPALVAAVLAAAASHERPAAVQLRAVEVELELALAVALDRILLGNPGAAVPQEDGARAVLLRRDHAFEVAVLDGMVLDVHREALVVRVEARAFRHGPAQEHPAELEPEVVVQVARGVLLDDEAQCLRLAGVHPALGLGRGLEVALAMVGLERHGAQYNVRA